MTSRPSLFVVLDSVQAEHLGAVDKLVLLYLAWRQGRNGTSWPSLRTIEADLHIDRRTRRRSIARLCETGCIEKTSGGCGRGHSNRYVVLPDERGQDAPISPETKGGTTPPFEREKRGRGCTVKGGTTPPEGRGSNQKKKRRFARDVFVPPGVDEVRAYAESRGVPDFDAARFVGYYDPRGWVKVNGEPVQDWKATVRTWIEKDNQRRIERGEPPQDGYSQYGTRPTPIEEAEAALKDS